VSKTQEAIMPVVAVSLHQSILSDIEQRILSGQWPPGHPIPAEYQLADDYGCSRMTVNKVLTQLVTAGMVQRRRKAGSFVIRPPSRSVVLAIHDIRAEVAAIGQPYSFTILGRIQRESSRIDIASLDLERSVTILDLVTLHYAGVTPFCLEQRLINLDAVPEAAHACFVDQSPGAWLVHHVPWTSAEHRIKAASAGAELAPMLKVKQGNACLVIERRTWIGRKPVTFVRLTYPGEAHELVATFSPTQAASSQPRPPDASSGD
jgi:GntR family transcriptional regulator, histidine utilization repressor